MFVLRPYAKTMIPLACVVMAASLPDTASAEAGDGVLTVRVFRDLDVDGDYDGEPGEPGITVRVFDDDGDSLTGVSNGSGIVDFDLENAPSMDGGLYRVEIAPDELPGGLAPAPASGDAEPFVIISAGSETLGIGVHDPADFCSANPDLITTCFVFAWESFADGLDTVVRFPRGGTGPGDNVYLANNGETGTLVGLAYSAATDHVFAGAFAKRHNEYGPGGPGAIYVIDNGTGNPTGNIVATISIPNAGSTPRGVDATTDSCAAPANPGTAYRRDSCFFDAPGKESLGDVEISEDQSTIWTVNLNDRHLYSVDVTDPTNPGAPTDLGALADPGCPGGASDWRPFALAYRDGELYVGGVCSGEAGNTDPVRFDDGVDADGNDDWDDIVAGSTDTTANLRVVVRRVTSPTTSAAATTILNQPLDFRRGRAALDTPSPGRWHGWVSSYDRDLWYGSGSGLDRATYPQPLLGDIEFDTDGSLILSFRDRFGDQIGDRSWQPALGTSGDPAVGTIEIFQRTAGDLKRACFAGPGLASAGTLGDWDWEGTGSCPQNGNSPSEPDPPNDEFTMEFYPEDRQALGEEETSLGHVAALPIFPDVASTHTAPISTAVFGVRWHDNTTGALTETYGIAGFSVSAANQKGSNLGDLEYLCSAPRIEIGDYVWLDVDEDGIQDPTERPIPGVKVFLHRGDGTFIDMTTTDADGLYYFTGLAPLTDYVVRFDPSMATDLPSGVTPADLKLTQKNADSGMGDGRDDIRDSDPMEMDSLGLGSTLPEIELTTGNAGENDHTFDAGFCVDDDPDTPIFRDPGRITFRRNGLDLLKVSGRIMPPMPIDPANEEIRISLTNPMGTIWEGVIPAGECIEKRSGSGCRFRDRFARRGEGMYDGIGKFGLRGNALSGFFFMQFKAYADLSAATVPEMKFRVQIGDQGFFAEGSWIEKRNGWMFPLPAPGS